MNREQKAASITQLHDRFKGVPLAVLTDYRGLAAGDLDRLRREVRGAAGLYQVVKNTLTLRALGDTRAEQVRSLLAGPTAIVFGFGDPVPVAKVLVKFAGDHEALSIKGAVLEGEYLTADAVKQLAELPSREQLLGQLLSLMQAPATRLLRTMNEPAARVTQLVEALRRKLEEGQPGGG